MHNTLSSNATTGHVLTTARFMNIITYCCYPIWYSLIKVNELSADVYSKIQQIVEIQEKWLAAEEEIKIKDDM